MANGQLWEIDSQGNKKQISGMVTGERPKYTMAEYTALTDKPVDWICTDYDATSEYGINATEVKYGNTNVKAIMDTEALTITYTQNNYVSSVDACSAYKKNNTLYFNLNIGVSGSPTPDFVEIGRIANWTAPKQLQMQVVGQSSSFTMVTVNITISGVIQLYFPMTIGSTTNFRQNSSQVLI